MQEYFCIVLPAQSTRDSATNLSSRLTNIVSTNEVWTHFIQSHNQVSPRLDLANQPMTSCHLANLALQRPSFLAIFHLPNQQLHMHNWKPTMLLSGQSPLLVHVFLLNSVTQLGSCHLIPDQSANHVAWALRWATHCASYRVVTNKTRAYLVGRIVITPLRVMEFLQVLVKSDQSDGLAAVGDWWVLFSLPLSLFHWYFFRLFTFAIFNIVPSHMTLQCGTLMLEALWQFKYL